MNQYSCTSNFYVCGLLGDEMNLIACTLCVSCVYYVLQTNAIRTYVEVCMNTNCIGFAINVSIERVRFRGAEYGRAQVTRKFKENVIQGHDNDNYNYYTFICPYSSTQRRVALMFRAWAVNLSLRLSSSRHFRTLPLLTMMY